MCRAEAEKIWREMYGNKKFETDFHGNYMCFEGYGNPKYCRRIKGKMVKCGWNIHHILPKSKGGPTERGNLICTNIITNQRIADKTTFWLDDKKYQIIKKRDGYVIRKFLLI